MNLVGRINCTVCGHDRAQVTTGKGGTLSVKCINDDCGSVTFVKRPTAVLMLRARLGVPPPGWRPAAQEQRT